MGVDHAVEWKMGNTGGLGAVLGQAQHHSGEGRDGGEGTGLKKDFLGLTASDNSLASGEIWCLIKL